MTVQQVSVNSFTRSRCGIDSSIPDNLRQATRQVNAKVVVTQNVGSLQDGLNGRGNPLQSPMDKNYGHADRHDAEVLNTFKH
jgi:hypothetical protein